MIEIVVKVTSLLLLGAGVTLLLRWHSAAARHFVWVLVLSSALVLPLIVPVAPEVSVELRAPIEETASPPVPALPIVVQPTSDVSFTIDVPPPSRAWGPSVATVLTAIWILGVVLLLARTIVGHIGLMRIARKATPIGPEWESTIRSAIMTSGVERPLRFAYSYMVGGPIAWGSSRPIVLFPPEAENWPPERMRVALLHELAHIARHDHASQLVAQLACALYWFHPLVWFASRALHTESEHACDDRVLEAGMPAPDYAELLVDVARTVKAPRFNAAVAMSMARHNHLEDRLSAVLDEDRSRESVSTGVRAAGSMVLGLLLIPLAGLTTKVVAVPSLPKAPPAPAAEKGESRKVFVQEVDASSGETLQLLLDGGAEVRVLGWDAPRVRLEINFRGDDASGIEIVRQENGLRVHLHPNRSIDHEITIRVPRRFDVTLQSGGGGFSLSGVEGTFRGNTGGGPIRIKHARGRADLNTGGGEIDVSDSTLDGRVNTGGGEVRVIRVEGDLRATSGSGPVIYKKHDSDPLRLEQAGGDIHIDQAPRGGKVMTGGGNIHIGRSGPIEATTGGGNIELGPVTGSAIAKTGAGNVTVVLDGEAQTIDLASGTGNMSVTLPGDFEGTFELQTAFAGEGAPSIQTPWNVPIEVSPASDGHRYVRARGKVGNGSGRLRVRTSFGNISVRAR
jgi:beta-lactamase regulating signal transducer with metallopeptidase domain/DUF4097 and DUF4098 domain-containing protein YvlB